VLLHPYLSHLFERGGFFLDGDFVDDTARKKAAIYLNFIVKNSNNYEEEHLVINKILTGLCISEIVDFEYEIPEELVLLSEGLLDAFIGQWNKISNSTHDGVRGGWFWRKGKLIVSDEKYELTVEQKAYDILMDQLPFTLSPVKYSWMKKPLIINWR